MNVVDTWESLPVGFHAFGDTCIAVMFHNNISAGAIGGGDHQMGMHPDPFRHHES